MESHTHLRPPLRPPFRKLTLGLRRRMPCLRLLSGSQHRYWLQASHSLLFICFSDIILASELLWTFTRIQVISFYYLIQDLPRTLRTVLHPIVFFLPSTYTRVACKRMDRTFVLVNYSLRPRDCLCPLLQQAQPLGLSFVRLYQLVNVAFPVHEVHMIAGYLERVVQQVP